MKWTLSTPHWRDIHGSDFVEAFCEHGTGHHKGVHGCDGCCADWPEEISQKVTVEDSSK